MLGSRLNDRHVCYFEDSPAAKLVSALRGQYVLRAVQQPVCVGEGTAREKLSLPLADEANGAASVWVADLLAESAETLRDLVRSGPTVRVIGVVGPGEAPADSHVFAFLPREASPALVEKTVAAAFENIELAARERAAHEELERAEREMDELNRIGVALSAERDVQVLLNLILLKTREITGADAGSLYLVEDSESGERVLHFLMTQNDSRYFPSTDFTMPISEGSMAGYVALHGEPVNLPDAYQIPSDRPYRLNTAFDERSGYRTRSMLNVPMKDAKGGLIGVLQLINCKRNWKARLETLEDVDREVQPFSARSARLALSLASQAAVAYDNSKLYDSIESLLEGFVRAAVTAIEQRDPTTSGHSLRVSTLTEGLAETVDAVATGPYASTRFTREQMKEIRYAALLHDFGKVGVREEVLVKAKKLYPFQIEVLRHRFDYIRKELEAQTSQRKLQVLLERSREEALKEIGVLDEQHARALAEIDDYFQFILQVNEPTVLPEGKFDRLLEIARRKFSDSHGNEHPYLTPDEIRYLSIPKGSLDPDERSQIESHVIHTFNFLSQIPWTKELKQVPWIARAHHETLIGTGYPYKLKGDEIPPQTKIMTICDIFDALSASDRPYKKAVPPERALDILDASVRQNELDSELFRLFLEAKIYTRTLKRS
jgi:HD-GYP domain-containing protein (c-di-GMP phosphodiesterase class II)